MNHSQIYRSLAKLEEDGFLTSHIIEQSDKPNKKLYSITESGKKVIGEWFLQPNSPAILKDEFVLKAYLIGLQNREDAIQIFEERILYLKKQEELCQERLELLKNTSDHLLTDFQTVEFGRFILLEQLLHQTYASIRWCEWVIKLLKKDKINYFNHPF